MKDFMLREHPSVVRARTLHEEWTRLIAQAAALDSKSEALLKSPEVLAATGLVIGSRVRFKSSNRMVWGPFAVCGISVGLNGRVFVDLVRIGEQYRGADRYTLNGVNASELTLLTASDEPIEQD